MKKITRNLGRIVSALLLVNLMACDGTNTNTPNTTNATVNPVNNIPAGQLPSDVKPLAYDLDLVLDPEAKSFSGIVSIQVYLTSAKSEIYLHSEFQRINSGEARLPDGQSILAKFEGDLADGGVSRLRFETPLPAGEATLILTYDAPYNFGLAGLYKIEQAGHGYLATQMEAIDARKMFPSFDDPQFKTPFTTHITAPEGTRVLTNGPLERSEPSDINGFITHHFKTTRVLPTYLVAIAIGPYEAYPEAMSGELPPNEVRNRPIPFRAFAPKDKADKLQLAVDITPDMVEWLETYFDMPYPYQKLDILAAPDFAYGAMENAGLIIYREASLLADSRTPISQKNWINIIHAHELAHQWFGNLVTPKWWDDIWLNEAFATWMSYKALHGLHPEAGYDRDPVRAALRAMRLDQLSTTRQIRNPITSNADIDDAFDAITYRKGGGVLNMFETYVGENAFRDGVRAHMRNFADGVADVDDFMASLAQGSGNIDIEASFRSFIFQPGIPHIALDISCDEAGASWSAKLTQSRYAPPGSSINPTAQNWDIPFAMVWGALDGTRATKNMMFTDPSASLANSGECPEWIMPNAGGTGYWRFSLPETWWDKIITAYTDLSDSEKLMMIDSLDAAFIRGEISAQIWQKGIETTLSAGSWDTQTAPLNFVLAKRAYLDTETDVAYSAWATGLWQPLYNKLQNRGASLDMGNSLLRDQLANFLAELNGSTDPEIDLAELAAAFIGLDAAPQPDALDLALLEAGIAAGYEKYGINFLRAALETAKTTTNQSEQGDIISALAISASADDLGILADIILGKDKPFKGREIYVFVRDMMANANTDRAWEIFTDKFDTIIEAVPNIRRSSMAGLVSNFCDTAKAANAEAFILANKDKLPRYERKLAQGVETANLCAAAKANVAPQLSHLFAN